MIHFYLKIGLDIGRVFAKCLIFDECFLSILVGCQKVGYLRILIYMFKSIDWFKEGSFEKEMV